MNGNATPGLALQAEGLHTFYGKSHILHGVGLEVREGEIVALLGRNGAGKSTTFRSIIGLVAQRDENRRIVVGADALVGGRYGVFGLAGSIAMRLDDRPDCGRQLKISTAKGGRRNPTMACHGRDAY